jgi:hypothetical protein
MMNIRNLKLLSMLIIVMVWCIPVFASVSHINCTCCTLKKPCCESASQNKLKIEKSESSCSQCRCNISEKGAVKKTYLITTLPVKKNVDLDIYEQNKTITPVLAETGAIVLRHTLHLKFTPLFIKNSTFLL